MLQQAMPDVSTAILFTVVFMIGFYWFSMPKNMPPGPPGLPVLGNMFGMATARSDVLGQLHKYHQKYGDVFTLWMGSKYTIVINSYKILHDTFVKQGDIFSGRPNNLYTLNQVIAKTGSGIIFSDGPQWRELRRVTLTALRDLGVGKKSLEQRVQDEAHAVVNVLDKKLDQPASLKPLFTKFTANVICSVILGNRFDYDDATFVQLLALLNRALTQPLGFSPVNFVPALRFLPVFKKKIQDRLDTSVAIDAFLDSILKDHEETYNPKEVRDFVDLYIKTRLESEDAHLYTASSMRRVILDLFVAGTETASSTLYWAILYLIAYPDVQTHCQQDIDKVVGQNRQVAVEDRKDLPYIEAVIAEILRVVSVAPFAVPHMTLQEGTAGDYTVPEGCIVLANLREIHHDPSAWSEPDAFRPERFLDVDGKFHQPKENYVPFSIGPRVCLGESLARMEIFILLSFLLQSFTFSMSEGVTPDLKGHFGITFMAKNQDIVIRRR